MWRIFKFLKFGIMAAAFIALFGAGVMLLWNNLVPELFHGPVLNYWQALGLLVLTHLLFRGGPRGGHRWRREMWHRKMQEKLSGMTPEEKEKFFQEWGPHGCWKGKPS